MKRKECPSCGVEIEKDSTICPICGYEFPVKSKFQIKTAAIILLILFLYPLIKLLINLINR